MRDGSAVGARLSKVAVDLQVVGHKKSVPTSDMRQMDPSQAPVGVLAETKKKLEKALDDNRQVASFVK